MLERIKRWWHNNIVGDTHNHREGDWRADCPAQRCQEIAEDYQAYIDAQGPTMNPHKSEDGLWR